MKVRFFNIQGFRGDYTYEIDEHITIINSKHNGVGKTTLYDCLRFLCDSKSVDKDEHAYYLNLNEPEGLFSVELNNVLYGFALRQNSPPVFYRTIEGELEVSDTNFPTVSQDIGILIINGAILNIFSKELNLFSSSNAKSNYALVKELTTHEQTEEVLELMLQSVQVNKNELSEMKSVRKSLDQQIEVLPYYTMVSQLESLINSTFYEDLEQLTVTAIEYVNKLSSVDKMNFNSGIEAFEVLMPEAGRLIPDYGIDVSSSLLENLNSVSAIANDLMPSSSFSLNIELLEMMDNLTKQVQSLMPITNNLNLDTSALQLLDELIIPLNTLVPIENLTLDTGLLNHLSDACISVGKLITGIRQEEYAIRKLFEIRESAKTVRVSCPIREEVYLVDGKCCY